MIIPQNLWTQSSSLIYSGSISQEKVYHNSKNNHIGAMSLSIYRKRENMGLVLRKYIVGTRTHFGQKKLLLPFSQVDLGFEARGARLGTGLFLDYGGVYSQIDQE